MTTNRNRNRNPTPRQLLKLATITHEAQEEDVAPEDVFSGDDLASVRERMLSTKWAWCCVRTTATLGNFSASAYLGGCSYESEEDFAQSDDGTQALEACVELLATIEAAVKRGTEAKALLTSLQK